MLGRVVSGEVVEVTEHGHPIARIVPLAPGILEQMVAEGRATAAEGDLLGAMEEMGLPVAPVRGRKLPSRALSELRALER